MRKKKFRVIFSTSQSIYIVQCTFLKDSKYAMMLFGFLALGSECTSKMDSTQKRTDRDSPDWKNETSSFSTSKDYLRSSEKSQIFDHCNALVVVCEGEGGDGGVNCKQGNDYFGKNLKCVFNFELWDKDIYT